MDKLKKLTAAILCVGMLTSCEASGKKNKATDLPEKYKKNLSYALGDYSIEKHSNDDLEEKNDIEIIYDEWDVTFTDKNGIERTEQLFSSAFDDSVKEMYGTKENLELYNISSFYFDSMRHIASEEMWNDIVSKYFDDIEFDSAALQSHGEDVSVTLSFLSALTVFNKYSETDHIDDIIEMKKDTISSESGVKLCEEDLSSVAGKNYMIAIFRIHVNEGIAPEPYIEKMRSIITEFEEKTGNPQNYIFEVRGKDSEEYFSKYKILGEEKDALDFIDENGKKISPSGMVRKGIFGK